MAISGDLRFASHHDTMRAVERLISRAKLPVRFTQGFNPRPVLSLSVPRSVGIASCDDRLILSLNAEIAADDLLTRLNAAAPQGMAFGDARELPAGASVAPRRVAYTAELPASDVPSVADRINELQQQDHWPIERRVKAKRRSHGRNRKHNDPPRTKTVDLKPRIAAMSVDGETLHFETICSNAAEARPADVLSLLGLDSRAGLATLMRTRITDDT